MDESTILLYEEEVISQRDSCRNASAEEFAILEWVDWNNHQRLFKPIGYVPPAGQEVQHHRQIQGSANAALLKSASFRVTPGDPMVANSALASNLRRIGNEHLTRRGGRFALCPTIEPHQSRPNFRDIPSPRRKYTYDSQQRRTDRYPGYS